MIPFVDLRAQYHSIKPEIDLAVADVLESAQFVLGDEVQAFETEFAAYCGTDYGIAVNSGTSALHLALIAAGIGPGDEVITTPLTFVATVAAICYAGAQPVFVDIDPESYTIDPNKLEAAINPNTRAVVPVHLYGQPAEMDPVMNLAEAHDLVVIEDAAQAHGAEYKSRRAGGIAHLGCFSFYPGKNLGAYGEAGMVVTDSPDYAETMVKLRDWGQTEKYHHVLKGFNYRMDAIQGAILRVKLRHLEDWIEARRSHAARYDKYLIGAPVQLPREIPDRRHVYHIYAVRSPQRATLQQHLEANGIQTGLHYPLPVHLQPAFADLGYLPGDFPCSEMVAAETLSLPMYAELTEAQTVEVIQAVQSVNL